MGDKAIAEPAAGTAGGVADTAPESAPAAEASAEVSTSASETESPTHDFDWDSWDGSVDALPETARGFAPHFEKFYTSQVGALEEEMARYRAIYESYMQDKEDPRVAQFQGQLSEQEKIRAQLEKERDNFRTELESFKAEVQKRDQAAVEAELQRYVEQNKWMFDNGPMEAAAEKLYDAGFGEQDIPIVLRQPQAVRERIEQVAAELKAQGVPNFGTLAIRLGRAEFKDPEPEMSASIIAGASGPTNTATATDKPSYKNASIGDVARHFYQQAEAAHRGRRS